MKKLFRVKNAIACEFVTKGEHGKHVLVNAYAGDIRVQTIPAKFPIAFYVEVLALETPPEVCTIELKIGRKKLATLNAQLEYKEGIPGLLVLPQIKADVKSPGKLSLTASAEGFAKTTLYSANIYQDEII